MPTAANLYYFSHNEEIPNALPILLIHGAGGSHLHFPAELRRLNGYKIIAPDLPAHGKSQGLGKQTIDAYVQVIRDFIDAINLPPALIIGHSMGSAIALRLAQNAPEYVLGLTLIGGGATLRVSSSILTGTSSETTFAGTAENIVKWSFGPHALDSLIAQATKKILEVRPTVLHGDFVACNEFELEEDRREKIQHPALIICGKEDKMTPPKLSRNLQEKLPQSELHLIEDAGHMVMLEKAHEVAELIKIFAEKLSTTPLS